MIDNGIRKARGFDIREADNGIKRIIELREKLLKIIDESTDKDLIANAKTDLESLEEFVDSMCFYTLAAFNHKKFENEKTKKQKDIYDKDDRAKYQDEAEGFDKKRSLKHDELVQKTRIINTICKDYGLKEIYLGLPDEYKDNVFGLLKFDGQNNGNEKKLSTREKNIRDELAYWAWDLVIIATVSNYLEFEKYEQFEKMDYEHDLGDLYVLEKIFNNPRQVGGAEGAKRIIWGETTNPEKNKSYKDER